MESATSGITVSCIPEYKDYTFNTKHEIWASVSLKAPCHQPDESEERAAMDIVAVIDRSGSMSGEKLRLVKKTLQFVLTQLGEKDRLGLVTYDTGVYVNFDLISMTGSNKETTSAKIENVHPGSTTNLSGGLMKGLDLIAQRFDERKNDVASVLLFTDGLANVGITETDAIVELMKKRFKKVDDPVPPPRPSPTRESTCIKENAQKHKLAAPAEAPAAKRPREGSPVSATVYTFGFGADHDAHMLKEISDAGSGMYYFIESEDKIIDSFAHCLGGLMSTVAQNIQVNISAQRGGLTLKKVHSAKPSTISQGTSVKVDVGDLQSEECRDILIELAIDAVKTPCETAPQVLLNICVDYFSVVADHAVSVLESLKVHRPAIETSRDDVNVKIAKEKCRIAMTTAMVEADTMATQGNYDGARKCLADVITTLKKRKEELLCICSPGDLAEVDVMMKDLAECQQNTVSANMWHSKGRSLQTTLCQQHQCQRSANSSGGMYQTTSKSDSVKASKTFVSR